MQERTASVRTGFCALALFLFAVIVAGCGGGGSSSTPVATATPTATPTVAATATPASATATIAPSATNTATVPASNGISGTFSIVTGATFPSGVSTTVTAATSGAPAPQSAQRHILSATALASWKITFSGSTATASLPSAPNLALTGITNPSTLIVELFDVTAGGSPALFIYSSTTGTFVASGSQYQIPLGDTFYLEVVSGSTLSTPAPSPTSAPVTANACTSGAAPASTTLPFAPGTVTLTSPTVGGCSITNVVPGVTTSGTVTATLQLTAPSGLPSPPSNATSAPVTPVFYLSVAFNNAFTQINAIPSYSITLPSIAAGVTFYVAQWQTIPGGTPQFTGYIGNCQTGAPTAMTVSGNTLSLPEQTCGTGNETIPAGTTLTEALVYVPSGAALPAGAACTSGAAPSSTTEPYAPGTATFTSPVVGGCSVTFTSLGTTDSGTIVFSSQLTAPAGLATPAATGSTGPPSGFALPFTAVFYATMTFNDSFANTNGISASFNVPSIAPQPGIFYVAEWLTPAGGTSEFLGYAPGCDNSVPTALDVGPGSNTLTQDGAGTCSMYLPAVTHVPGASFTAALVYF